MRIKYSDEIKNWSVYFITAVFAVWIHEIGHCVPAWVHGYEAFPSPAEEYILHPVSIDLNQQISLGGYLGTLLITLISLIIFLSTDFKYKSALFAGTAAVPGMYCVLFFFNGRGHGGHEFQEAQAALGFNYYGHSLDVFFWILFISLVVTWFVFIKPSHKIIWRVLIGVIATFFFFIALEWLNNAIFDPVFQSRANIRN